MGGSFGLSGSIAPLNAMLICGSYSPIAAEGLCGKCLGLGVFWVPALRRNRMVDPGGLVGRDDSEQLGRYDHDPLISWG